MCLKAIYKITNKLNNKSYIGQSNNPTHRWKKHKWIALSKNYVTGKSPIHDALLSVGVDNFEFTIIGWFKDYNDKEREYIKKENSLVPNGYNLLEGGEEPPHKYGENHHNSKYSQKIINKTIELLLEKRKTQIEICDYLKVSPQFVTSVNRGIVHRRKGLKYPLVKTSKYHCSEETLDKIIFLLKYSTCTCSEIALYFGFDTSAIKAINSGRNHFNSNITYPIRNFRGKKNSQSVEAILAKRSTMFIDTTSEM